MATILVDGKQTEIETKRITLVCHSGNVHLMPDGQVEIGPEQTIARANRVSRGEWIVMQADPLFRELLESVIGAGAFPMVDDLAQCGMGVRHMTGMILMFAELEEGQTPYVRYPESFLHPSSAVRLADFFIRMTGGAK
jgi:hypothetical protein